MNKVKMFFIAAALVLTTAGVFAGKAKFSTSGAIYASDGTHYYQLSPNGTLPSLQVGLTGAPQATITSSNSGPTLGLYSFSSGSYSVLYTQGF